MSVTPTTPLLPFDVTAVAAEARAIMRMKDTDADAPRVDQYADAATQLIETYIDPCAPWAAIPDPVQRAAAVATVEGYRRKDAPFGVLNAWSPDDIGPVRIGMDWLNPVLYMLLPYKCAWGIA